MLKVQADAFQNKMISCDLQLLKHIVEKFLKVITLNTPEQNPQDIQIICMFHRAARHILLRLLTGASFRQQFYFLIYTFCVNSLICI